MTQIDTIDDEYLFEGNVIISETDLKGIITFANRRFCEISGFSAQELVGRPHNIIRHPDMPKHAFETMWKTIEAGESWRGLVKNLRKDGRYYWVATEVAPIKDAKGVITGYIAARKPAARKDIEEAAAKYKKMLEKEREGSLDADL